MNENISRHLHDCDDVISVTCDKVIYGKCDNFERVCVCLCNARVFYTTFVEMNELFLDDAFKFENAGKLTERAMFVYFAVRCRVLWPLICINANK